MQTPGFKHNWCIIAVIEITFHNNVVNLCSLLSRILMDIMYYFLLWCTVYYTYNEKKSFCPFAVKCLFFKTRGPYYTFRFKNKKLSTNSTRDFNSVLGQIHVQWQKLSWIDAQYGKIDKKMATSRRYPEFHNFSENFQEWWNFEILC